MDGVRKWATMNVVDCVNFDACSSSSRRQSEQLSLIISELRTYCIVSMSDKLSNESLPSPATSYSILKSSSSTISLSVSAVDEEATGKSVGRTNRVATSSTFWLRAMER